METGSHVKPNACVEESNYSNEPHLDASQNKTFLTDQHEKCIDGCTTTAIPPACPTAMGSSDCTSHCDLCKVDELQVEAVGFCINCTDFLCRNCLLNHTKIKVTRSHTILQGENLPTDPEPIIAVRKLVKCDIHPEYDIKFVCAEHSTTICAMCLTDQHRMCTFQKISELKEEYRRKEATVKANLLDVHQRIEEFKLHREKYIGVIEAQQKQVISEAQGIAQQLIEKIVTLTTKVEDTVNGHLDKETTTTKESLRDADNLFQEVKHITDLFEAAQKYGGLDECILASRHIDHKVKEIFRKICLLESHEDKHISLEKNVQLYKLDTICYVTLLGTKQQTGKENASDEVMEQLQMNERDDSKLNITTSECGTSCDLSVLMCNKEVQTLDTDAQSTSEATLVKSPDQSNPHLCKRPFIDRTILPNALTCKISTANDSLNCFITAIVILDNGKKLIADRNNKKIKLLSNDFVVLEEYSLSGCPIDMCVADQSVYVCCLKEKKLSRFLICGDGRLIPASCYLTRYWPVGLSPFDDKLLILCFKLDCLFDSVKDEKVVVEIRNKSKLDASLTGQYNNDDHDYLEYAKRILTVDSNSILLAEHERVSCYGIDQAEVEIGDRKWYYKNHGQNILENARGVALDKEGNAYICGEASNNVHQVPCNNYLKGKIIIANINKPFSVCVDSANDILIVGCCNDNYLHVFNFQ
ncbi:hypothetical protein DPMN_143346 [Dreissena polymorpha]|uniref:B box-type domain-containing protein n=1 Tax=Dreissena polymorpha TaxID=45954 RepID=A0A9D4JN43_DREPO|nr:hypothetical protein DPMN_143346 [Dreissena polymorpha]